MTHLGSVVTTPKHTTPAQAVDDALRKQPRGGNVSDQVVPDTYLDQAAEVGGLVAGAVFEVLYQDRRPASGPGS